MKGPQKKLAIFLPALAAGGAERTMLKLAGAIAARGYAVDMVLARAEGLLMGEVSGSVRVVDLHARRGLSSIFGLIQYLRHEEPQALLSGMHTNMVALWAARLARVRTRVVVSERTTLSKRVQYYGSDMRMRLLPWMVSRFYGWADRVVAVSNGVATDLIEQFGVPRERVSVIYNPIVTPDLQDMARLPVEHPWFKPGECPVILSVGRLAPAKDFPTLIRAFAEIARMRPVHLLVLGDGEERDLLERLIRSLDLDALVSLPGHVANPYPYMARSALFVSSSRWEGLPGALVEAMYCGAILVATDCDSGPREILAAGKYGRLVPVGDAHALAQALADGLDGQIPPPPRESWQRFEIEFVADQYVDVLFGQSSMVPRAIQ